MSKNGNGNRDIIKMMMMAVPMKMLMITMMKTILWIIMMTMM